MCNQRTFIKGYCKGSMLGKKKMTPDGRSVKQEGIKSQKKKKVADMGIKLNKHWLYNTVIIIRCCVVTTRQNRIKGVKQN